MLRTVLLAVLLAGVALGAGCYSQELADAAVPGRVRLFKWTFGVGERVLVL